MAALLANMLNENVKHKGISLEHLKDCSLSNVTLAARLCDTEGRWSRYFVGICELKALLLL